MDETYAIDPTELLTCGNSQCRVRTFNAGAIRKCPSCMQDGLRKVPLLKSPKK